MIVEGVYENNVGFLTPPGPDDYFGSIQASLTHLKLTPRSEVRLQLGGAGYLYRELETFNRADGDASLQVSTQLSSRVRGGLRGAYAYGHTDTEDALTAGGALLPLTRTMSGEGGGDLSWRLGERTTWSLDGIWRQIDFESDLFLDTETWTAGSTLARRFSRRGQVLLRLQFLRVEDAGSTRHEPSATLGFSFGLTEALALEIGGGAGRSETVAGVVQQPTRWDYLASAGLTGRIGRSLVSVSYQHGLQPVIGLGTTQVTDQVTLDLYVPIGRRLELLANGGMALRGDATEGVQRSRDADVFAGAAVRLARRLRFVAGYRFRYRDRLAGGSKINNDRASVSLAWGPESLGDVR